MLIPTVGLSAESISELKAKLASNPQRISVRQALAAEYSKKKLYNEVIDILSPFSNEIDEDSLLTLSAAYREMGDNINEIRILQFYSEKSPDRFRPYFLLAQAYSKNNQLDEAAQNYRKSIELAPKHLPSFEGLLNIFSEQKQNYESRTLINDMARIFGMKKEWQNQLCRLLAIDNFIDDALSACKKAISQQPSHPDNHIYLANTYYNQDNFVAAERIFSTAARQFPKSEFVQYAAGEYFLNQKKYPIAIRYLKQAIKNNSESMRGHLTLALALFEDKKYAEGLPHFEKSCKLDKTKETLTAIKNSAAKLRQSNESEHAKNYDRVAALCQP